MDQSPAENLGEFIVYRTEDERTEVQLLLVGGTVWLSQKELSELYGISVSTVSRHIKAVFDEGELDRAATVAQRENVALEQGRSVTRRIDVYSLDLIMAVGYRVRGPRGSQFRNWATTVLAEYLVKGFAMNDAKLKDPAGMDYFDELLERIRDIRASEKRFYQKVKDIFATAADYDPGSGVAKTFFATVQNKLTYAVTGRTSAELILERADSDKPNMGLTTWKAAKVRKGDVTVAKNYLSEEEIAVLNRMSTMYLDAAESRAQRREVMTMEKWAEFTDQFLAFDGRDVLTHAGSVSSKSMETQVKRRYDDFDSNRKALEADTAEGEHLAELERVQRAVQGR